MDAKQELIAKKAAKALRARIEIVNKHLEPLLAAPLSETYGKLAINEKAQLQVLLSYAVNSLFYMYLKTQGVIPQDHPVTTELARIRTYIEKIKRAEGRGAKASMQVDKQAAARFIKAALADDENNEPSKRRRRDGDDQDDDDDREEGELPDEQENDNAQPQKRARMDPFIGYKNK